MDYNELERLSEQWMFNELAQAAIEDMRERGTSFDEVFPLHLWDTPEKLRFRDKIKRVLHINMLPISTRGTYPTTQ